LAVCSPCSGLKPVNSGTYTHGPWPQKSSRSLAETPAMEALPRRHSFPGHGSSLTLRFLSCEGETYSCSSNRPHRVLPLEKVQSQQTLPLRFRTAVPRPVVGLLSTDAPRSFDPSGFGRFQSITVSSEFGQSTYAPIHREACVPSDGVQLPLLRKPARANCGADVPLCSLAGLDVYFS
jgi:hypothetical protein